MTINATDLLARSGWTPDRRVDVDGIVAKLQADGHVIVPPFRELIAEYSGLVVASEDGRRTIDFDVAHAALQAHPGWCEAYAEGIGLPVTPIAIEGHSVLLIDSTGGVWGAFDDLYGYLGGDMLTGIASVLVDPPKLHPFDRVATD